jgi:hypothetical protein
MLRFGLATILFAFIFAASSRAADDSIVLRDGVTLSGTITKEDKEAVYIRENNGEEHGVERADIAKILRKGVEDKPAVAKNADVIGAMKTAAQKQAAAGPAIPAAPPPASTAELIDQVNGLGSPVLAERKAAIEAVKKNGQSVIPIMLGMLDPRQKTSEYTRIAILRLLVELAPLDDQASKTLAFDAVYDPYPEARREACRTIKALQDDLSVAELGRFLSSADAGVRSMAAYAARELDDERLLLAIIKSIPVPEVTANNGPVSTHTRGLPVGPGGMTMPVTTGSQDVTGVAQNTDSPGAQLMKQIAGKDLGSLPYGWLTWYGEKMAQITSADYHKHDHKTARDGMNKTNGGSSYP